MAKYKIQKKCKNALAWWCKIILISTMDYKMLITLAETLSEHLGRSEVTLSNKCVGNAHLFQRLRAGGGCTVGSFVRVIRWFDANWPEDLEWPRGIDRPSLKKGKAA